MSIEEILAKIEPFKVKHVLLTGGEPLLQRNTSKLIDALNEKGYAVSIETHGEVSIAEVAKKARIVMDIKTPSSKMNRGKWIENLPHLKADDEVKFVIASREDYAWAKELISKHPINAREILFSPVVSIKNSPGSFPGVETDWLAEQILADRLPVRMQVQLHKLIWGAERTGV